ncbi:MAG: riboflavin synthase [Vampirovibrio sp.]
MFTGLIQAVGEVVGLSTVEKGLHVQVAAPSLPQALSHGASIALNGCCTTVTDFHQHDTHDYFDVTLSAETLACTEFKTITLGTRLNLELPLLPSSPLGGHYVTGHVDGSVEILGIEAEGECFIWTLALPKEPRHHALFVPKGSVALQGISLTLNTVTDKTFTCCIIPHTLAHTNLGDFHAGDFLHFEGDILGKYVQRQLQFHLDRTLT